MAGTRTVWFIRRRRKRSVQRRDFTINGLLMRHDTGEVLDFVGGQTDLEAKIIRAIGEPDRRFTEDKLRMMRAVRFAARFGFEIEPATFRAIRRHVREIHQVSPERLREELIKVLTEGAARQAFELLDETWLLQQVLPEIGAMKGVEQPPQYHPEGDVWIHTLMMLEGLPCKRVPNLGLGRSSPRRRQATDVPIRRGDGRPHSFQQSRRSRRAHGRGHLQAIALLQRGHRADPCARGQPHEVRCCRGDARLHPEEVCAAVAL